MNEKEFLELIACDELTRRLKHRENSKENGELIALSLNLNEDYFTAPQQNC